MSSIHRTPYFLQSLQHLREEENVVLYNNLLRITPEEEKDALLFLRTEYENESLEYPYQVPEFDETAALWAAKTVYFGAQLVLYRENKPDDLPALFPAYAGNLDAGAVLSADLCLRFLPAVATQLELMDPEDALTDILRQHLQVWHYSAVGHALDLGETDFGTITDNPCLYALYINRVIGKKDIKRANLSALQSGVRAALGHYAAEYWNEFNTQATHS